MVPAPNKPDWDRDKADRIVGSYVIIGITRIAKDGETVVSQEQFHGVVRLADETKGISIALEGSKLGEVMTLPPDLNSFEDASVGEYRLHSTGEVITNPDFTTSWTIYARK